MYCVKRIKEDVYWVGGSDRRLALFENIYPVPRGISYNAYVVLDEKTVLLDTADASISELFLENLAHVLAGRPLDYLIVTHMEPDHCALMARVVARHPGVRIVLNAKSLQMVKQFFDFDIDARAELVSEGASLCTGRHTFRFFMAPMVHWPEVMVVFDELNRALYSSDAFGTFGALGGNLYADEVPFEAEWLPEARRYYANIVGKYGPQTQALLRKMQALPVEMVCPLHGPVWRKNLGWYIEKYRRWSAYEPEESAAVILCGSIYGHTENAANILAALLGDAGARNVCVYDVAKTDHSLLLAECFRASHLVLAASTHNAGIFAPMAALLHHLHAHGLRNRSVALIENGTWASAAGALMREALAGMKDMVVLAPTISLRTAVTDARRQELAALAQAIMASMQPMAAPDARDFAPPGDDSAPAARKRFICKVCGYIHEGDELPADFICPICKHGADVFVPLAES